MISYCIVAYRPVYAGMLIRDLIRKTSSPYEILVWLNIEDSALDALMDKAVGEGVPLRVVGRTPDGIGMRAYRDLFVAARYPLIVQIDDDVLSVSRGIAERAAAIFERFPSVRQIVADVWQDEFTNGARPPMDRYQSVYPEEGLCQGPIDGWFSIYHRSVLPTLLALGYSEYCYIGAMMSRELVRLGFMGVLCTRMKVFHATGPAYASFFGMLDFEIEKYRRLQRDAIVEWYVNARENLPGKTVLQERLAGIVRSLDEEEAGGPF
jgi:hypothetical protein